MMLKRRRTVAEIVQSFEKVRAELDAHEKDCAVAAEQIRAQRAALQERKAGVLAEKAKAAKVRDRIAALLAA